MSHGLTSASSSLARGVPLPKSGAAPKAARMPGCDKLFLNLSTCAKTRLLFEYCQQKLSRLKPYNRE
jgi:hypothetical protein